MGIWELARSKPRRGRCAFECAGWGEVNMRSSTAAVNYVREHSLPLAAGRQATELCSAIMRLAFTELGAVNPIKGSVEEAGTCGLADPSECPLLSVNFDEVDFAALAVDAVKAIQKLPINSPRPQIN